jgi:hypothetical protein
MNRPEEHEPPINTRRFQRYELEAELRATIGEVEQRGMMQGRALNISEVGIAGIFVTGWDVGTPVHLEFSVPVTSSPVRVGAVVGNRTDHRYGFEFVDLSAAQSEVISKTCRTLALFQ